MATVMGSINRITCDVISIATPVDLGRIISIKRLTWRGTYILEEKVPAKFKDVLQGIILTQKGMNAFQVRYLTGSQREGKYEKVFGDENESKPAARARLLSSMRRVNGAGAVD